MLRFINCKKNSTLVALVVLVLLASTLIVTVFGTADLSSKISVLGLTANSSGSKDWTASAGSAVWEGTTSSTGGCSPTYTAASGSLQFTNNSGTTQVLSFDYTVSLKGGKLLIDGENKTTNGSFSKTLENGASVTLAASSSTTDANTTKITLSNIKLEVQQVTITFVAPTNGSYTVDGAKVTANKQVTKPSTTTYKLVATPAENYYFAGWYLGDTKVSENATWTGASFATNGDLTAKFVMDPLFALAETPADSAWTKDQLVIVNTWFAHDPTDKLVPNGGFPGNNSAYTKSPASQTKDKYDVQYIPSQVWNDGMAVSASGSVVGDYATSGGEQSHGHVRILSDIIRIEAKENCNIVFSYTGSMATDAPFGTTVQDATGAFLYTYITTSSKATIAQVMGSGSTKYSGNGTTASIALSKGQYLYIMTEGYAYCSRVGLFSASQCEFDYTYNAAITDIQVSINEKKDVLTAGFQDNTGKILASGKITVNNVAYSIGSNGYMTNMEFADLAAVELKINTVPTNYVHIGWKVTPKGGAASYYYTPTYSRTLAEDVEVIALFAPKTIITMGSNGYADATYKDVNGNALSGQYVARNADRTKFYTSLADAFADTNTVVLLAGSTIVGDWEITSGKTFVIPYGMEDAGGTAATFIGTAIGKTYYCDVTLKGNLNVKGTLIVNGQQNWNTGAPGGTPGHLNVASGKVITVSGAVYAYGPITGEGSIQTTSTAQIHECIEFSDNGGPAFVFNIYDGRRDNSVFPFSTMFINSIEIPVNYRSGATLTGHLALKYDTVEVSTAQIPIIGASGAMMNHAAGTITKYFDRNAGQFVFRFDEGSKVATGSFAIKMDVTLSGISKNINLNSDDYYIPLSAPFRFEVAGELTIKGRYKMLPGMTLDVKKSGKLIIPDGSELILYRRNDFDYRGRHTDSTEQWGYTHVPYPLNPTRFPGCTYPFSFTNANMGSAKLIVDGELIVNGGIYVTDQTFTPTENGTLAFTDNGYNCLIGTGKIVLTNAKTGLTIVNEAMRASGTNDIAWAEVKVVPLRGIINADTTENKPENYVQLGGIVCGIINEHGLTYWKTVDSDWVSSDLATNVALGNSLEMFFAFKAEGANDDWKVVVKAPGMIDKTFAFTEWKDFNDGSGYYVVFEGLAAKQMTDTVYVLLYNGNEVVDCWNDSIRDYSYRILANNPSNANLKDLILAMLDYGAACQTMFNYNTGNMANTGFGNSDVAYTMPNASSAPKNDYFDGSNLITTSNIQFAVMPTQKFDASMEVTYTFKNHWGKDVNGTLIRHAEGYYYVDKLVVADAKQTITITVNGVEYTDSIENYCARMYASTSATANQKAAVLAFMKFSVVAETYLKGERVQ